MGETPAGDEGLNCTSYHEDHIGKVVMTGKMHVWPEENTLAEGWVTVAATLEIPQRERQRLWYRIPAAQAAVLGQGGDPFVVGAIFSIMSQGRDCIIHGRVSPSLLNNLWEFQAVWACWRPGVYTQVEITADIVGEQPPPRHPDTAALSFSGGVDSAFSAWRHRTHPTGRLGKELRAGIMVQGFDIGLEQPEVFERAAARSEKMMSSLGMTLIPISTNFRQLGNWWEDAFGAGLASCLQLFAGEYGAGLISSSHSYANQAVPYASNAITDRLMSSNSFSIIYDGAAFSRVQKVRELAHWDEALKYLRVCWEGRQQDHNCGKCRKCIRTILEFRAAGLPLPACFERDANNFQIATVTGGGEVYFLPDILDAVRANRISGSWVWALYARWWYSRLRHWGKHLREMGD